MAGEQYALLDGRVDAVALPADPGSAANWCARQSGAEVRSHGRANADSTGASTGNPNRPHLPLAVSKIIELRNQQTRSGSGSQSIGCCSEARRRKNSRDSAARSAQSPRRPGSDTLGDGYVGGTSRTFAI